MTPAISLTLLVIAIVFAFSAAQQSKALGVMIALLGPFFLVGLSVFTIGAPILAQTGASPPAPGLVEQ